MFLRILFIVSFAGGCVLQTEGKLMQADIKTLRAQLDAVKSGIDEDREALKAAIVRAEKKTQEVQEALDALNHSARRTDADLGIQLDTLQKSVQQLTGAMEELRFKVDKSIAAAPSAVAPTPDSPANPDKLVLPRDKKAAVDLVQQLLGSKDGNQRDDGKRLAGDALNKWPKDEGLTDVVRIALGDRLSEEKQYSKALVEYKKVLDAFPKGARADVAMFKLGNNLALTGNNTDAKMLLEEMLRRYPKSTHAKEAKAKIAELDKPKKKTK